MTRFEQFQQNVQRWATERGIYEHSTALAQALKTVSEVGELCDAVIKNDRDALIDAIGDSAVTLINAGRFYQHEWDAEFIYDREMPDRTLAGCAAVTAKFTGELAARADDRGLMGGFLDTCMYCLFAVALRGELDFDDCCESAWQTVKDRKGRMVAGGAFVKESGADPKLVAAVNLQGLERCSAEGCPNSRMLFSRSCPEHQSHD